MNQEEPKRILETFSIVGTGEQLAKFKSDFAKVGWKLRINGYSGSWLGEPICEIIAEPITNKPVLFTCVGCCKNEKELPKTWLTKEMFTATCGDYIGNIYFCELCREEKK